MGDSWPSAQAAKAANRRKASERRFIFLRSGPESFFFLKIDKSVKNPLFDSRLKKQETSSTCALSRFVLPRSPAKLLHNVVLR